MPEDFSRDMPAEDLVESLDITDLKKFDDPAYGNLIRRWWDIKAPGFFGKNLGVVMLDISVNKVPENKRKKIHGQPFNIKDRLDLLLMVDDALHQRYDELIEETAALEPHLQYGLSGFGSLMGKKLQSNYRNKIIDGKKWVDYSAGGPYDQLIVGYILPITESVFLEFVCTYSPNHNVFPRAFREVAYKKTDLIEDSLSVSFTKDNKIGTLVSSEQWLTVTNDQVLEKNRDKLLVPMFGPNIYKELEEDRLRVEKERKALGLPIEEDEEDNY